MPCICIIINTVGSNGENLNLKKAALFGEIFFTQYWHLYF